MILFINQVNNQIDNYEQLDYSLNNYQLFNDRVIRKIEKLTKLRQGRKDIVNQGSLMTFHQHSE